MADHDRKDEPKEVGAEEAKKTFGELLQHVGFGGKRFLITRHGKPIAALVSASDLATLDSAA